MAQSDDDDNDNEEYFLRRLAEELRDEGEDSQSIWKKTKEALDELVRRLAKKLRKTFEEIWEALRKMGDLDF